MNAKRRKEIADAIKLLDEARSILESVAEQEREAYENMPESIQMSERGDMMEETVDVLERIYEEIGESIDELDEIC